MDNFTFYAPTYFDFGKGSVAHVADLIKQFGGGKVLLHYGGCMMRSQRSLQRHPFLMWNWAE